MVNKVKRVVAKNFDGQSNVTLDNYEDEIDYLIASGVVNQTRTTSNSVFPLNESISKNLMKLYYNDVGVLTAMLYRNNIQAILNRDSGVNLGPVYEMVCAMGWREHGHELFYFDSKKVGEVDFLINDFDHLHVLPIQIKSGKDPNNFRAIPKLVSSERSYQMQIGYVLGNKNVMEEQYFDDVSLFHYVLLKKMNRFDYVRFWYLLSEDWNQSGKESVIKY